MCIGSLYHACMMCIYATGQVRCQNSLESITLSTRISSHCLYQLSYHYLHISNSKTEFAFSRAEIGQVMCSHVNLQNISGCSTAIEEVVGFINLCRHDINTSMTQILKFENFEMGFPS